MDTIRKSRSIATMVAVALLLVCASAALAAHSPVLGWTHAFSNGTGFGSARPAHVYLGGDPTGDVQRLQWHGWGRARATGFGTGWCPGRSVADGHYCPASLHVSDLGRCHGHRAYRQLAFYFKSRPHRRWVVGSKWNACTGQPVF